MNGGFERKQVMEIIVVNSSDEVIAEISGEKELNLVFEHEYGKGDRIIVKGCSGYLWIMLDEALGKSMVYMKDTFTYYVPYGEKKCNLSPKAFTGRLHFIHVREAYEFEINAYQNLAVNVNDQHENLASFPHASANVETRGESVFAARNAIDGITANCLHGLWPFASWGINRDPEAVFHLDFGRKVRIDRMIIYLRADFPHDSWWEKITAVFSDGSKMGIPMEKTSVGQEIVFGKKEITWLELRELKKAMDESPFPALAQIEVYGYNIQS